MEKIIDEYNSFVMTVDLKNVSIGLFDGEIDLSIYFYHQHRLSDNKIYFSILRIASFQ